MTYRYKLIDTDHGPLDVSGRFNSLEHAMRDLNAGEENAPGRFKLVDRETGETIAPTV